ncbi:MAG TPA: cysteine desulfurase [Gammaproteobacteria bacterium]|nr:cysteine desulfurase [Gammaproteobacteria bacterium]
MQAGTASLVTTMDRLASGAFKADFPILQQQVGNKPLVYLDSGASSQKPQVVIDAMTKYYCHDHSNVHRGVHTLSQRATHAYEQARQKVADFINAPSTDDVVFVRGTTEAINLVANSYGASQLQAGDEVLITALEHHANIVPWQMVCERIGARLRVLPINDCGELRLDQLDALLSSRTRIVAVAHISNALGTVNPVAQIVERAHALGVVVLVDGAQSIPHAKIDVQALDCDFFCFSGHKVYGPTGIGVLYGRQSLLQQMPPWQGGGDMIRVVTFEKTTYADPPLRFEAGTPDIAEAIGLGAALDYVSAIGLDKIAAHEKALLEYATAQLSSVPGLRIIGTAAHKAAVVSFLLKGIHPHDLGTILDAEGVAIRAGHHCAMPVMQFFSIPATARASFGLYNTMTDIDALVAALHKARKLFGL